MSERLRAGWEGYLYVQAGGYNPSTILTDSDWVLVSLARDVTLNDADTEAEASTRGNNGFKAWIPGLTDTGLEVEILHKPDDPAYQILRDAKVTRSPIGVLVLDRPRTDPDGTRPEPPSCC